MLNSYTGACCTLGAKYCKGCFIVGGDVAATDGPKDIAIVGTIDGEEDRISLGTADGVNAKTNQFFMDFVSGIETTEDIEYNT